MNINNESCNTVSVSKGTTIFSEEPFAYVVESTKRNKICNYCLQRSEQLWICSACKYVYYCKRECQEKAWPIHKIECTNLKVLPPSFVLDDIAWLMARVIIKLNKAKKDGADETDSGKYSRKFNDLMSHSSGIEKDKERMQRFDLLRANLLEFLDPALIPEMSELLGIYGRICINSICIFNERIAMEIVGIGIYLRTSVLNHSCDPDVVTVFEGATVFVRTLVDIPSLDWSQLRRSYIDVMDTSKQETLYNKYYFRCDCEKCKQLEPKAAACPNSLCASACSIETDKCEKCGAKLSKEFKEEFRKVINCTNVLLEINVIPALYICEVYLKSQKDILHKFSAHRMRSLDLACKAAINCRYWEDAELYGKALEPGYLFYYGEVHFETGLLYLTTTIIYLNLRKWDLAFEALEKANSVLTISYGNEHSVMKKLYQPIFELATVIKGASNTEIMTREFEQLFRIGFSK